MKVSKWAIQWLQEDSSRFVSRTTLYLSKLRMVFYSKLFLVNYVFSVLFWATAERNWAHITTVQLARETAKLCVCVCVDIIVSSDLTHSLTCTRSIRRGNQSVNTTGAHTLHLCISLIRLKLYFFISHMIMWYASRIKRWVHIMYACTYITDPNIVYTMCHKSDCDWVSSSLSHRLLYTRLRILRAYIPSINVPIQCLQGTKQRAVMQHVCDTCIKPKQTILYSNLCDEFVHQWDVMMILYLLLDIDNLPESR